MVKIGNTIIEDGLSLEVDHYTRTTVRAIILDTNNIYMLYSSLYNDFTFPGGGLKEGENMHDGLKRELLEELGANEVNIIKDIGYTEELKYGLNNNDSIYLQTSYFILCEIDDIGSRTLNKRELTELSKPMFVDIDMVIEHNNRTLKEDPRHQQKGFKTVLMRENLVLEHIKTYYLK